jgi:hypothetical protein
VPCAMLQGAEEAAGAEGVWMGDSTLTGRDARTGQFIPVKDARQRPNTTRSSVFRNRGRA